MLAASPRPSPAVHGFAVMGLVGIVAVVAAQVFAAT